ncbi:hypothetical protein [Mycoplasma wenyonii]|nr:hypothetical protein [Mycoplasma wenyonii]
MPILQTCEGSHSNEEREEKPVIPAKPPTKATRTFAPPQHKKIYC